MNCNNFLEVQKDCVYHKNYQTYFVAKQTLIEDVKCETCDIIKECWFIKHLEKLQIRKEEKKEKRRLQKLLTKK